VSLLIPGSAETSGVVMGTLTGKSAHGATSSVTVTVTDGKHPGPSRAMVNAICVKIAVGALAPFVFLYRNGKNVKLVLMNAKNLKGASLPPRPSQGLGLPPTFYTVHVFISEVFLYTISISFARLTAGEVAYFFAVKKVTKNRPNPPASLLGVSGLRVPPGIGSITGGLWLCGLLCYNLCLLHYVYLSFGGKWFFVFFIIKIQPLNTFVENVHSLYFNSIVH